MTAMLAAPEERPPVFLPRAGDILETCACPRNIVRSSTSSAPTRCWRARARTNLSDLLRIRTRLRDLLRKPQRERLGKPSRFREGDWVRVLERERIRAILDGADRSRGLWFTPQQWEFCGGVFRVSKIMRRIIDDQGKYRPVHRTVLLNGVSCGGIPETEGCGRHCPLMFRDEWLEPAPDAATAQPRTPSPPSSPLYVVVRSAEEIRASLDSQGRRDGLMVMNEMYGFAGRRFRVAYRLANVLEHNHFVPTRRPVYVLEGVACTGAALGDNGPCDRRCPILWHGDWLRPENPA